MENVKFEPLCINVKITEFLGIFTTDIIQGGLKKNSRATKWHIEHHPVTVKILELQGASSGKCQI